jgi:hypothetical protein
MSCASRNYNSPRTTSPSINGPAQAVLGCVANVLVRVEEAAHLGGAPRKLVEKPFRGQPVSTRNLPAVNGKSSMLPLIAEFCVRTGHLNELLEATKKPKFPTASLAMMVMELEEMVALNFNLFSDSQLEAMPNELATLRENSELQTYSSRAERGKAASKEPALQARVRGRGPGGRCRNRRANGGVPKGTVFLPQGSIAGAPESRNRERQGQSHRISRQPRVQSRPRGIACALRTTVQLGVRPFQPRAWARLLSISGTRQ